MWRVNTCTWHVIIGLIVEFINRFSISILFIATNLMRSVIWCVKNNSLIKIETAVFQLRIQNYRLWGVNKMKSRTKRGKIFVFLGGGYVKKSRFHTKKSQFQGGLATDAPAFILPGFNLKFINLLVHARVTYFWLVELFFVKP